MADDVLAAGVRIALTIASDRPDSMLPCPACDASVKGRNVRSHIENAHPAMSLDDTTEATEWRGRSRIGLPARLIFAEDELELRRVFGDRGVRLPAPLVAAGVDRAKATPVVPGSDTYTTEIVKAGTYLQIGTGRRSSSRAVKAQPCGSTGEAWSRASAVAGSTSGSVTTPSSRSSTPSRRGACSPRADIAFSSVSVS